MPTAIPSPAIAIVTPCFNQEDTLATTLDSVLGQNYPGLQYVVADGGSTDSSRAIIEARQTRLHRWFSARDGGQYDAINKGFAETDAEIMGWINADDLHLPWTLSVVGEIFARFPAIQWLTSLFPLRIDHADRAVFCRKLGGFSRHGFLCGDYAPGQPGAAWPVQQESTFWRRSLWNEAGGLDTSISHAADFDLWMKFSRRCDLVGVETPLAGFRQRAGQRSVADKQIYDRQVRQSLEHHGGRISTGFARWLRLRVREHASLRLLAPLRTAGMITSARVCRRTRNNSDWELLDRWV